MRGRSVKKCFLKTIQFNEKINQNILGLGNKKIIQFSEKINKNILGPNFFDPKLTRPKLFSNRAYRETCVSSELLRACLVSSCTCIGYLVLVLGVGGGGGSFFEFITLFLIFCGFFPALAGCFLLFVFGILVFVCFQSNSFSSCFWWFLSFSSCTQLPFPLCIPYLGFFLPIFS